jgi:hypothetical protein
VIRRSDVHLLTPRALRVASATDSLSSSCHLSQLGFGSLSDRACRKRDPAWNGYRNARDRISHCLQRPELLRIEAQKDVIAFFASLNYEVPRGSTVSP